MGIKRVKLFGFYVSDQDQALDFYINKLGFEKVSDSESEGYRWIEIRPPGAETHLVLAKYDPEQPDNFIGGEKPVCVFIADDIERTYQELSGRGVEFIQKPEAQPWGKMAVFVDPDRNKFALGED